MIFVGVDWSEDHHDIDIRDPEGRQLAKRRIKHGVAGVTELHELAAEFAASPGEVIVGIEIDRGLLVASLVGAGYQVHAVNPRAVDRYRDRHALSGAKSDPGDALVLAELVRTDRHHHRTVAGDSDEIEGLKIIARSHQNLVWARTRHVLQLRSTLLEYFPAALAAADGKAGSRDILAVLTVAPHPDQGRALSRTRIETLLRRAGRTRNLADRASVIHDALQAPQLTASPAVTIAHAATATSLVAVIAELTRQIERFDALVTDHFDQHPDAAIVRSLPGLGTILGARVLSEFGDDPNRYVDAKARRNYAGTSPITRASGKHHIVLARYVRNHRLADACDRWAFAALTSSPGARRYYDEHRAAGATHRKAIRALANRLVGILHGCLTHHTLYEETIAWSRYRNIAA